MEKVRSKIKVRDVVTQQVLFECDVAESEKAFQFAAEMEEMGLDIEVVAPSLGETLSASLGLSQSEIEAYKQSMEDEIEHHDGGSCCFESHDDDDKKPIH